MKTQDAIQWAGSATALADLLTITPSCHWLEYVDWATPILQRPLAITDGYASAPDLPGNGIAWNEEAIARFAG